MDIKQNSGCVWPAAIEEEAPRFGPPDFVVMKKMQLVEEKQKTGIVPARVDAVHLASIVLGSAPARAIRCVVPAAGPTRRSNQAVPVATAWRSASADVRPVASNSASLARSPPLKPIAVRYVHPKPWHTTTILVLGSGSETLV